MKKTFIKGAVAFGLFAVLSLGTPTTANAMFSTMSTMSSNSAGPNMMDMFSNSNFAMEQMQSNQLAEAANSTNKASGEKDNRVSATGYLKKEGDKYYIGEKDEGKHQVLTNRSDVAAVMPLVANTEVPVEFIGEYDAKKKIVYATNLNLLKKPSPDLQEEIDKVIKEWTAKQPVSGKGYVILEDGEYKLEVKNKVYTIETEVSDVEVVLPFVADDDDLMIELIGPLNKEEEIFTAQQLNFVSKLPKELLDEVNEALLKNKDGKEVNARGYIRNKDGVYSVKVLGESYNLILTEEHPDIKRIVPVVAGEELLINVIGKLNRSAKTIDVNKLDIIDRPSAKLLEKINKAIEGYEEGTAQVRGKVISKSGTPYFKVGEKEYKLTIEEDKEDLEVFLDTLSGKDQIIQVSGYISNKNLTLKAGAATIIGQPSDALRAELAEAMEDYIEIPETGKSVDAQGEVIEKDGKYYISVAFHDYLIKTTKVDMQKSLVVLSESGIPVLVTGKIDNKDRFIDAEKLVILEEPNKEVKAKLDKIIADTKAETNTQKESTATNNPFANFGNFAGFGNLFGNKNADGTTTGNSNPFANFGNLFANLGGGNSGGTGTGTGTSGGTSSPFGDFGSLFQNFFGNGTAGGASSPFSSLFSGSQTSGMPSLSFDQIQQQLNSMGKTPTTSTGSGTSTGTTPSTPQGGSFGSGDSSSDKGSGFSAGGDE